MAIEPVTANPGNNPPPAPSDLLEQKMKALKEANDTLAANAKTAEQLEAQIKELGSWISEYKGYEAAAKARSDDKKAIQEGADKTVAQAKAVLSEEDAKRIDAEVTDYDADLETQQDKIDAASTKATTAAAEAAAAQDAVKAAQAAYDAVKDGSKESDAHLKTARVWLTGAQRSAATNELAAAYFLATEAGKEAGKAEVLTLDERDKRIRVARKTLDDATADAAKKKAEADRTAAVVADFVGQLDADRKARIDVLLKTIGRKFMAVEEDA